MRSFLTAIAAFALMATSAHAHPSFSPDGLRILIQSGLLTEGRSLALIVVPVSSND